PALSMKLSACQSQMRLLFVPAPPLVLPFLPTRRPCDPYVLPPFHPSLSVSRYRRPADPYGTDGRLPALPLGESPGVQSHCGRKGRRQEWRSGPAGSFILYRCVCMEVLLIVECMA